MRTTASSWLLAAGIALCAAVAEAAAMIRLVPGTTAIDTGALLVTGFLAGLFAGFYVARGQIKC